MQKRNAPMLRFKDNNGQEFPAWEKVLLGDLYAKNVERNKGQFGEDKTISIAQMQWNPKGNGSSQDYMRTYKILRVGDIAFEGNRSKDFQHGRFVLNDIGDGIISPRFTALRPKKAMPLGFWKEYIHREATMNRILVHTTKAGTMMNELVLSEFLAREIYVPSLPEQQKIGNFFTALNKSIAIKKRKVSALADIKKGILQKIFSQELRFKDDDGLEFPAWEEKRLNEVCFIQRNSIQPQNYQDMIFHEFSMPAYDRNQTVEVVLGSSMFSGRFKLEEPCILYNKLNLHKGRVWNVKRIPYNAVCSPEFIPIIPLHGIHQDYLFAYLSSNKMLCQLIRHSAGTSNSQQRISVCDIKNAFIPLPSLPEQQKIAAYFSHLDNLLHTARQKLIRLQECKKGMLQQMFI